MLFLKSIQIKDASEMVERVKITRRKENWVNMFLQRINRDDYGKDLSVQ